MSTTRRRWYRPRNVAGMIGVALAVVASVTVYRAVTAQPGRSVDYGAKMVEICEAAQMATAGKENAWPLFIEIARLRDTLRNEIGKAAGEAPAGWPQKYAFPFDFMAILDPSAPPEVVESSLDAMAYMKQRGLFDKLALLAQGERFILPEYEGELIQVLLPELGSARDLARMNVARMAIANRTGDRAERLAAFEQNLVMVRALASQPILISRLTGAAISALTLGELKSEMMSTRFSADELAEILGVMDRQLGAVPPLSVVLNGERLFSLDTIQWTHTDNGHGDGTLIYSKLDGLQNPSPAAPGMARLTSHPIVNVMGLLYPSKADSTAKANEFFDNAAVLADLPRSKRAAHPFRIDAFADNLPRGYVLLKLLLPAIDRTISSNDIFLAEVAGVRAMVAVEMYRARHGQLPLTLDALVPEILPSLPIDPFSGSPFGYRLVDDPASDRFGRGYLLYSVGLDGEDDQGTASKGANFDALRTEGKGSDYIINTPP
ncbi:MAG: hypothetical protein KF745_04880 [Phycisphaeraceae bacterium]|nr:hypothetical protein [Phycisphaeraceae bacterium]